jgi:hypothetical protein
MKSLLGLGLLRIILSSANHPALARPDEVILQLEIMSQQPRSTRPRLAKPPRAKRTAWSVAIAFLSFLASSDRAQSCREPQFAGVDVVRAQGSYWPTEMAVADLNGDGRKDLLVPNATGIAVLLASESAEFQAPVQYTVGAVAQSIQVGDLDGDGKLDVVVSFWGDTGFGGTRTSGVGVLLGKGDGTVGTPVIYDLGGKAGFPGQPPKPVPLVLGDFNGDGKIDLAAANFGSDEVAVFPGKGDGAFALPRKFTTGSAPIGLLAADFNGDGHPDLATANVGSHDVSILLGEGDGAFGSAISYGGMGTFTSAIRAADVNGDGNLDLLVTGSGLAVLPGNSDGTFGPPAILFPAESFSGISVTDLNGDGYPDLGLLKKFGSSPTVGLFVTLGNGKGQFGDGIVYNAAASSDAYLVATDLDGDQRVDLAVLTARGVSIIKGNGDGTVRAARLYDIGLQVNDAVAADLNGDGMLDLAFVSGEVMLGAQNGTFLKAANGTLGVAAWRVVAADFNGDGIPDIARTVPITGELLVNLGSGDGTFLEVQTQYVESNIFAIVADDFNKDGRIDLAATVVGGVVILLGNGDGSFNTPQKFAGAQGAAPRMVVADFNKDGKNDLATANEYTADVTLYLGNGDGTFKPSVSYASGQGPSGLVAADFNGDGNLDLAVANSGSSFATILLGQGEGTFVAGTDYELGRTADAVVAGDFNGDGKNDLAFGFGWNELRVALGRGDGTFADAVEYIDGGIVALGDFNEDGKVDFAVISGGTSFSLLLNACSAETPAVALAPNATLEGKTMGEWSAAWQQWAMSLPAPEHPLFDTAPASQGQKGDVWFLGGKFCLPDSNNCHPENASRKAIIPEGKYLYFPVVNTECSTIEGNGSSEAELRACARGFIDHVASLSAEVDGFSIDLSTRRVASPAFTFTLADHDNLLKNIGVPNARDGASSLSVDDGYYVMVNLLPVGSHTIHFHGEFPDFDFVLDFTYDINVVSEQPLITYSRSGQSLTISWNLIGFALQQSDNLGPNANWQSMPETTNPVTVNTSTGTRFYRLNQ